MSRKAMTRIPVCLVNKITYHIFILIPIHVRHVERRNPYKPARVEVLLQPSTAQILCQDTTVSFLEQTDQAGPFDLDIC